MIIKNRPEEILSYLEDASNVRGGQADRLFIPENEQDILDVVRECSSRRTPLTVSGGGTGTVGGRVPRRGSLLSMEKFNRILEIRPDARTAHLESGVVIKDFLSALDGHNLFYPPFPTERSGFIGGNVATNASGEYSYRFGATRRYVQGLRMILTTGEVVELERGRQVEKNGTLEIGSLNVPLPSYRTPLIKCTAGYYARPGMDAIDLMIGSEGTLGIVTQIRVSLIEALPPRFIMVLFLPPDADILALVRLIRGRDDLGVYSLEFFDPGSLVFLKPNFPEIPDGCSAVYVEAVSGTRQMEQWLEISERFCAQDAMIGEDSKNYERLIDFRHRLPENINSHFRKLGITKVAVDASVPRGAFPELFAHYRQIMATEPIRTILFGHIGEDHLHFNFFPKDEEERERAWELYAGCARKAVALSGTVSAEHGIGKIKHKWLNLMFGEKGIREMAAIKKMLDPACILGLDNIFPSELLG